MKKLAVIVPWDSPFVFTAFAFNIANMERPDGYVVNFFMGSGFCPAARHNDGIAKAQQWGADIIMFDGADHLCDLKILKKMLKSMESNGVPIVQASPPSRGVCDGVDGAFKRISYKIKKPVYGEYPVIGNKEKDTLETVPTDQGPQVVHVCGTGNIMFDASILEQLERPYFVEFIGNKELFTRIPVMDSNFVSNITINKGIPMVYEPDIEITHLDVFAIDKTYQDRFSDKAENKKWTPAFDMRKFIGMDAV